MIELLTGQIGGWLLGAVGVLAAIAAAWWKGRQGGKQEERDKQVRDRLAAREAKDEIREEVAQTPIDKKREEAKRWGR